MTDGEKLIVVMLADLYRHLKVEGEINPDRVLSSVFSNNLWSLKSDMTSLYGGEEPSEEVVDETFAILSLWSEIEFSVSALDPADRAKLAAEVPFFGEDPKFQGFDGNNDKHYAVAKHIVDEMGRFEEFKGRSLNSHSSISLSRYRDQREAREKIAMAKPIGRRGDLSVDDLISILKA